MPDVGVLGTAILDGLEGSVTALEALGAAAATTPLEADDRARRRERCAALGARLLDLGRARSPRVSFTGVVAPAGVGVGGSGSGDDASAASASPRSASSGPTHGSKSAYAVVPLDTDSSATAFPVSVRPKTPTREERRKTHRAQLAKRFLDMDNNGDGEISIEEFAAFMSNDGLSFKEAKALFNSVDENGDGTMDQMEFITLMESKHPLLKKVPWAVELAAGFADAEQDDEIVWVDPESRPWFMLSPHDNVRVSWDMVTAMLLVYVAIIEPLRLGFAIKPPNGSFIFVMDWFCDVFFVADFVLNFRTGYLRRDTGTLDMNPRRSALVYLRTWAILDFVSSVPPVLELFLGSGPVWKPTTGSGRPEQP
jgi:hypothetical protein